MAMSFFVFMVLSFTLLNLSSNNVLTMGNKLSNFFNGAFSVGPCDIKTYQTCPDDNVTFWLMTRKHELTSYYPEEILVNDKYSNLQKTTFNATHPTKIIIHGYASSMWFLMDMKTEYLHKSEHNVVYVQWGRLAAAPWYSAAVDNVPHVGKCLAQLVERMWELAATDIHVIGFSLGAHVAGFTANNLKPYKLSRITGLDPAMPLYITVSDDKKLDFGDAVFVDVYHTSAFTMGKIERSGHIDFYMNGGVDQPECDQAKNPVVCNHERAEKYFTESINTKTGFWGWSCPGFLAYSFGWCPAKGPFIVAGDRVDKRNRGYYLVKTGSTSPFADDSCFQGFQR